MSFLQLLVTTLATAQVLYTALARRQIFVSAILDTSVSIITAIQKLYAIVSILKVESHNFGIDWSRDAELQRTYY